MRFMNDAKEVESELKVKGWKKWISNVIFIETATLVRRSDFKAYIVLSRELLKSILPKEKLCIFYVKDFTFHFEHFI